MGERETTAADVADGIEGAARMLFGLLTPSLAAERSHHGTTAEDAARARPGDELVPAPRWGWHHAIEIAAPASAVWPWVVQMGADRAGFYSYEALENLAGCELHNAERIHPEWQRLAVGDGLRLHPKQPPLPIVWLEPERGLVAGLRVDLATAASVALTAPLPPRHVAVSWAFLLEPIDAARCRFVSRYRVSYGDDLRSRISLGPTWIEPIGTAMDLRMLEGIRRRAEHRPA